VLGQLVFDQVWPVGPSWAAPFHSEMAFFNVFFVFSLFFNCGTTFLIAALFLSVYFFGLFHHPNFLVGLAPCYFVHVPYDILGGFFKIF
jgi:predicted membrane metal-binding protein